MKEKKAPPVKSPAKERPLSPPKPMEVKRSTTMSKSPVKKNNGKRHVLSESEELMSD